MRDYSKLSDEELVKLFRDGDDDVDEYLMEKYKPEYFIHGHIHRNYDFRLPQVCSKGNTTVINAYEYCIIETDTSRS